jgi:hypothetical protein
MQSGSLVMSETLLFILKSLFFAFFDIFQQNSETKTCKTVKQKSAKQ